MCLLSVLPKGTEKYNDEVSKFIRQGFECNGDGSGYMFKRHNTNTITLRKGYDNLDKLLLDLKEDNLQVEDELVIHHRIRSVGFINAKNCHPYVISNNDLEINTTNITIDKPCLAHNGTFKGISQLEDKDFNQYSDTYAFCKYFLSNPYIMKFLKEDSFNFKFLFKNILNSSRVAILMPDRDVLMLGDFIENKGYFHSNEGYCEKVYNRGGINYYGNEIDYGNDNINNIIDDYLSFDIKDIIINLDNYTKFSFIKEINLYNKHIYFDDLYVLDNPIHKADLYVSLKRNKVYYNYVAMKQYYRDYRIIIPKYTINGDFSKIWLLYTDYNVLLKEVKNLDNKNLKNIAKKISHLLNENKSIFENGAVITDTIFNKGELYLKAFKLIFDYCMLKLKQNIKNNKLTIN